MNELREQIEDIFGQNLACDPERQAIGISIEFNKCVDLSPIFSVTKNEATGDFIYRNKAFYDLVNGQGVVAFNNAVLSCTRNVYLSGSDSALGLLLQDVPHFDDHLAVGLMAKEQDATRDVPTYYFHYDDVKDAIARLSREGLSDNVADALDIMQGGEYLLSSEREERYVRNTILNQMPEFTDAVYDLAPEGRKLRHDWTGAQAKVVAHSNLPKHIIHARPTGPEGRNILKGVDIWG